MTDRRDGLRRRYLSLGLGELAAAVVFVAVALVSVQPRLRGTEPWALWSALLPLVVVLLQAGAYWLAARRWVERGRMPSALATTYRAFRLANLGLLAAGGIGAVWWGSGRPGVVLLLTAVWLFGAVEYANYFVVRLAYPLRRWVAEVGRWRTPRLVLDLAAARAPEVSVEVSRARH